MHIELSLIDIGAIHRLPWTLNDDELPLKLIYFILVHELRFVQVV